MIRLIVFLAAVAVASLAAAWIAERPGEVVVTWMGWRIETSMLVLFAALVALTAVLVFLWTLLRLVVRTPRLAANALGVRRRRKGERALSKGLIALASGDLGAAQRFAGDAARLAADAPLTLLLKAQAAQVAGDRDGADKAFRAMAERADTRLLGLRGLFVEAERRGDHAAARRHAEEAARSAPALPWAGQAVFEFRSAAGEWAAALETLETNLRGGLVERPAYRRRRAVLLTARALDLERRDPAAAKTLALEAVKLAGDLVPAATLAAHLCAEAGEGRRAARILEAAWRVAPHPDIADLYAHLRAGDSARDRLARVRQLARIRPDERESALALARAALDAREFAEARAALAPLLAQPTQRVATLMAELEEAEHGDAGRAREWMGRALRAARDPAWTADGMVSERWLPVSPVTGRLDAFAWRVPLAEIAPPAAALDVPAPPPPPALEAAAEPVPAADAAEEVEGSEGAEDVRAGAEAPPSPEAAAPRPAAPRQAAVIPLMRAPDDPGIDADADEAARGGAAAPRVPLA
jgi:HemY protein